MDPFAPSSPSVGPLPVPFSRWMCCICAKSVCAMCVKCRDPRPMQKHNKTVINVKLYLKSNLLHRSNAKYNMRCTLICYRFVSCFTNFDILDGILNRMKRCIWFEAQPEYETVWAHEMSVELVDEIRFEWMNMNNPKYTHTHTHRGIVYRIQDDPTKH